MSFKPSKEEQRWARQLEMDLRRELLESLSPDEREALKELHWKKCPKDGIDLVELEINNTGIIIDKCMICGGVWFDKSDLENISQAAESPEKILKIISRVLGIEISKAGE